MSLAKPHVNMLQTPQIPIKDTTPDSISFSQNWKAVRGLEFRLVQLLMFANLYWIGLRLYRQPRKAWQGLRLLLSRGEGVTAGHKLSKAFRINGKYGWDMFHPLWPSPAFNRFFHHHYEEVLPSGQRIGVLRRLLVALTKKCPLQCAHCSEWDTLNQPDVLSREEMEAKIASMVDFGVSQIVYSGGEPLNRFEDLCYLLDRFRSNNSQWIYTSGYGLTLEKALRLKAAGLEGVAISLDHHEPEAHNQFRGNAKSYDWVKKAIAHSQAAGLFVSINCCPTKEYIAEKGIEALMEQLTAWQVPVVNVLEPRAVGHFAGQDVELNPEEKAYLETQFYRYSFEPDFDEYPILTYPALARKHLPCGGGVSYLLLDYDGTLRPCPFCKTPIQLTDNREALCEADLPLPGAAVARQL